MAIYHLSAKSLGRASGRSPVAAAAYRAGVTLQDERQGLTWDYSRRTGVLASWVAVPAGAGWASDRQDLWRAVDAADTRKNARLATELELALPHELDAAERAELVRQFAQLIAQGEGVAVDVALHAPDTRRAVGDGLPGGDARNWHAHLLISWRRVTATGMGERAASYDSPAKIEAVRAAWAAACNAALDAAGRAERIDHRSYARQGLNRPAGLHVGVAAAEMERRRPAEGPTDRGDRYRQQAQVIDLAAERRRRQEAAEPLDQVRTAPGAQPGQNQAHDQVEDADPPTRVTLSDEPAPDDRERIWERRRRAEHAAADAAAAATEAQRVAAAEPQAETWGDDPDYRAHVSQIEEAEAALQGRRWYQAREPLEEAVQQAQRRARAWCRRPDQWARYQSTLQRQREAAAQEPHHRAATDRHAEEAAYWDELAMASAIGRRPAQLRPAAQAYKVRLLRQLGYEAQAWRDAVEYVDVDQRRVRMFSGAEIHHLANGHWRVTSPDDEAIRYMLVQSAARGDMRIELAGTASRETMERATRIAAQLGMEIVNEDLRPIHADEQRQMAARPTPDPEQDLVDDYDDQFQTPSM